MWRLDAFLLRHPPVDLLAAAWLKYEPPAEAKSGKVVNIRDAARKNTEALAAMPPRRNARTLAQMPAFLRTPEQLAMIEQVKTQHAR